MNDQRLELIQTVVAMFKAASGAHYLSEFLALINSTGSSVESLANILAQTDVFKQSLYSDTLSNNEFANQFVENTVASLASIENKAWAAAEIERMLDAGQGRGEVIHWAATSLASVAASDVHWGMASQQFNNKVEVASFYSIDQGGPATGLSVLQQVTAKVTNDIASVVSAKASLESGASGKVIDGYIKGALVFADLNGDELFNSGEIRAITDALGNYTLPAVTGFGRLVVSGGTDISTGKPFEGSMTAPAGSTVVNPLTTLIDKMTQNGAITVEQAAVKVLTALGLDKDIDLLKLDPIKETIRIDTNVAATASALAIHIAAVQIQTLISQTAALLNGAGISADETTAIDLVYETLAVSLVGDTGLVDLTSSNAIAQVIRDAAVSSRADSAVLLKAGVLLAGASQTIANLNQAITDTSTSSANKSKVLASIAAVQIVAENIEAAMKSGAAKGNVSGTVTSTTGSLFTSIIKAAGSKVGDVNGDGKSDALPSPPSSGGGLAISPTNKYFLATNATAFSGTAANDILSISTAATWTPLVMTAVVLDGGAGTNTLSMQDGSSIASAGVINFSNLLFDATGVVGTNRVTMSATQNQNFTGTITAPGTGVNGEAITIVGDGAITTLANIEHYSIEDDATNARMVAVTNAGTNVAANSSSDAVIFNLGALTYTGTMTGEITVDDTLSLSTGADISGSTITNVEALALASGASIRLSAAQNQNFTGTITATGTGVNGEAITIAGDGAVTTLANIENYSIEDDSTNARTVTVTNADTNVTANSASDAVIFNLGALTYTGTMIGETTVENTLSLSTGADISGGTIVNVEALALASGASIRLSAAQNQNFTGTITATGTGVNGEAIIIVGDGAVTTLANIETYELDDDLSNIRTVTVTNASTNVTANSASDTVIFNLGALTYTGTMTGETTVDDTLSLSTGTDISGGTIANVEALALASGASIRLSAAQNQNFTGTITAPGTDVNGEAITIVGGGDITTLANIETYELEDDTTNTRTLTLGSTALTLVANDATDTITVNAAALAQNAALTLGASASSLIVNNLVGDIVASDLTGTLTITTANAADNGISIITGSAATSVNVAAGAASDTVSIDATALANNTTLIVTSDAAAAGTISVSDLTGNLTVSNPTSGTIGVAVADNTIDDGIVIAAGASNLAIGNVADGDTVTITGFTGSTFTGTIAGTTGKFNITAGTATNNITTGTGNDTFTFVAGTGLTIADTVNGEAGTDTVALTGNTAVAATNFDNVSNIETITVANTTGAVAITTKDALVATGAVLTLQATSLTSGVLTFNGAVETDGTFNITGGGANDSITGGSGNDILAGGDGNDSMTAGLGSDTLSGGAGNDTLTFAAATGLSNADTVDGGAGTDTVALTGNTAFTTTADFDNVQNIEAITLGNTNTAVTIATQDTLVAAGATLTLSTANTGGLTFNGVAEMDGAFNITSSGVSNDTITGGDGADTITAGMGTDTIVGGGGDDTIRFTAGTGLTTFDIVDGGSGTDTVALTSNTAVVASNFDNVSNIEAITVANTTGAVAITTKDTLVAAGAVLALQVSSQTNGVLTFNGSAETDGAFTITGGGANDSITGSSGNDTLTGGNGNDSITAGLGTDTLFGGAGNDTLRFAAVTDLTSVDVVDGGAGTDTVALTGNTAFTATTDFDHVQNVETITLGNTNTAVSITTQDTLVAAGATLTLSNSANSGELMFNGSAETDANFNITGGSGNDSIIGGSANNTLSGGTGDDTFTFAAGTGLTTDTVNGGTGTDTVTLTGTTAVTATQFNNVSHIEVILLPDMVNTAVTITTVNALVAAGATLMLSNAANSEILTFNGAAETDGAFNITGGTANDSITGGSGNDIVTGGSGNDSMTAGLGNDTLSGDTDNDTFTFVAGTGLTSADIVDGGAGTDMVALTGNTAIATTNFNNVRNIETITIANTTTNVAITTLDTLLATGAALTLQATSLTTGVLTFNGSAETNGTFTITGGGANDTITGGSGNDTLTGGNGNDSVTAGLGSDTLSGGAGNDTLRFAAVTGLTSADAVDGGAGTDTVTLTGNTAFTAGTYFDNVQNIEAITLANTNTAVTITTQNTLVAAGTTMTLTNAANSGMLTFDGSAETDGALTITGGTSNDSITGGSGNDTVSGGTGNDTLIGGAGNDIITSGAGSDSITAGAGADTITLGRSVNDNTRQTIIYNATSDGAAAGMNSGVDTITQFDANANSATDDLIQITGTFKTIIDDDHDGALDYSVSNGTDLGNQTIVGGADQEATVLLDAEIEIALSAFTTSGLADVLAELGEEIDFTGMATGEEHLFIVNFSATQAAVMLYTAESGGDDTIVATDIQVLGIVTHNDGTGLVAGNMAF